MRIAPRVRVVAVELADGPAWSRLLAAGKPVRPAPRHPAPTDYPPFVGGCSRESRARGRSTTCRGDRGRDHRCDVLLRTRSKLYGRGLGRRATALPCRRQGRLPPAAGRRHRGPVVTSILTRPRALAVPMNSRLSHTDVTPRLLTMEACLEVMADALRATSQAARCSRLRSVVWMPYRTVHEIRPDACLPRAIERGWETSGLQGREQSSSRSTTPPATTPHQGVVILFDTLYGALPAGDHGLPQPSPRGSLTRRASAGSLPPPAVVVHDSCRPRHPCSRPGPYPPRRLRASGASHAPACPCFYPHRRQRQRFAVR